jgi:hypothetical protein
VFKKINHHQAISESIGTILLVAMTVLIAAIISAYAMGVVGKTDTEKTVAVTATRMQGDTIHLTYNGGQDQDKLHHLVIISPNASRINWTEPKIGDIKTVIGMDPGNDRVMVVGYFWNGEGQVILDTVV